jgi:hypothetical protein
MIPPHPSKQETLLNEAVPMTHPDKTIGNIAYTVFRAFGHLGLAWMLFSVRPVAGFGDITNPLDVFVLIEYAMIGINCFAATIGLLYTYFLSIGSYDSQSA